MRQFFVDEEMYNFDGELKSAIRRLGSFVDLLCVRTRYSDWGPRRMDIETLSRFATEVLRKKTKV